jgi:hypothetical protein
LNSPLWKCAAATLTCGLLALAAVSALSTPVSDTVSASVMTKKASKRYAFRGAYDRDFSATGFNDLAAIGFNLIDSGPNRYQMRPLAARGLKGLIWLGGYSNTTCTFNESDEWVRSHVKAMARRRVGHSSKYRLRRKSGVGAYLVDDEPSATECPSAPAQMKARSRLVKSIDPRPPTLVVINRDEQLKLFARTVDVIGLDHYPCSIRDGCEYSKIDRQAATADRLGIRYWGVIQAVGDDWYKIPTPEELHQQFVHWRATKMRGYLVYAWHYPEDNPSLWLANNSALRHQLALENAATR